VPVPFFPFSGSRTYSLNKEATLDPRPKKDRKRPTTELVVAILVMLVIPSGLYLLAAFVAATVDGTTLGQVACFEPGKIDVLSGGRRFAAAVMAVAAVGFLFVVPGLLGTLAFMRLPRRRATAHVWSLAANSAALVVLCLLLRPTVGIGRWSLAVGWLVWTVTLFALAWQRKEFWATLGRLRKRYGAGLLIGLITVVAAITVLFPEQFLQCFSEDGTETRELARSLRGHFLPQWQLENWELVLWEPGSGRPRPLGRLGTAVVNPSLVNSYWTGALQVLLGDGELATRLPYWAWWMAVFAVSYRLVRSRGGSWPAALPLAGTMWLIAQWFSFYVGYNRYMADLANPGVPDALFTLLLLLSLDCLRKRDRGGWVITTTLASLVLYAGAVWMVLALIAAWWWRPIDRREVVRWGLTAAGVLAAVVVFYLLYGWIDGSLPYWIETIDMEYLNDYLAAAPRWISGPLFFGYFLLGCGGVAAWGLVWALRRDAWQRTVATVTLLYLLVVLSSGYKNLHYLGPLLPIPIVLFLLGDRRERTASWARCLAAVLSIVFAAWFSWPVERQTFTLNRELGTNTTIATDDYLTAVDWARIRHRFQAAGVLPWECDHHTWVAYAELDATPAHPRALVLTDGDPPTPEYELVFSHFDEGTDKTIRLYTRDPEWLARLKEQPPSEPIYRYPLVFWPLARGTYSPHESPVQDVPRLHWPW